MACPFFDPATPFSWHEWPNPPRLPLGDPYAGACTVQGGPPTAERVRTCCNTGYARGACPSFPGGDAPDAVRFLILNHSSAVTTIRFVIERDHYPLEHGTLQLTKAPTAAEAPLIERQARAYLSSYLRRTA